MCLDHSDCVIPHNFERCAIFHGHFFGAAFTHVLLHGMKEDVCIPKCQSPPAYCVLGEWGTQLQSTAISDVGCCMCIAGEGAAAALWVSEGLQSGHGQEHRQLQGANCLALCMGAINSMLESWSRQIWHCCNTIFGMHAFHHNLCMHEEDCGSCSFGLFPFFCVI